MAEIENLGDEMTGALSNALGTLLKQLLGFRTMLMVLDTFAGWLCGWCEGLLFREQGERKLRAWFLSATVGLLLWSALLFASSFVAPLRVGVVTALLVLWGLALGVADWVSAMDRRRTEATEGYSFSGFIGWPRFLPAGPSHSASYWQQAALLFLIGLNFAAWSFDVGGGVILMGSALAVLARLWVIRARIREDAMDRLDGEWLASNLASRAATMGGADPSEAVIATADVVSTADFLRRWSI